MCIADLYGQSIDHKRGFLRRMEVKKASHPVIYEIDHTIVDVLVTEIRQAQDHTTDKTFRPQVTFCIDPASRLVRVFELHEQPQQRDLIDERKEMP